MRRITFTDIHRQKHFDFFRKMDQPHFSICMPVDITATLQRMKSENRHFTSTIVYLISRAANAVPAFRQRIRAEAVVEHEQVHPSFTVQTAASEVFSFCPVSYQPDYAAFSIAARHAIRQVQQQPSFEDDPGRDDYLFLSSFPWASFTGLTHAMHYSPADSVPRFTWGKYYESAGRILMPLSVQAHHALVDGRHVGLYIAQLEALLADPGRWMA